MRLQRFAVALAGSEERDADRPRHLTRSVVLGPMTPPAPLLAANATE